MFKIISQVQSGVLSVNNVDDNLTGRTGNSGLVGGKSNDIILRTANTSPLALTDISTANGINVVADVSTQNNSAFEINSIVLGASNPNNIGSSQAASQVSILTMGQAAVQVSGQASVQSNGLTSIGNASVAISIF